jgi:aconitate hydratase
VLAKSIARIHGQNLLNFAVLPLIFVDAGDYDRIDQGDVLVIDEPAEQLRRGEGIEVTNETKGETYSMRHRLTPRQIDIVVRGSLLSAIRERQPG